MSKALVIVESPNKVKKIQSYLGAGYIVKASVGHIRDLPAKGMGVDESTHKPKYAISQGKAKVVKTLKAAAANASEIYLATDPDREGEAIAWHLQQVLGKDKTFKRVVFNEITKKALNEAFGQPGTVDLNQVRGQEARRVLDRYVGYKVSPALTELEGQKFTAGRVQSPAVALVVQRKMERDAFEPEDYLNVVLELEQNGSKWKATLDVSEYVIDESDLFDDEEVAEAASKVEQVTVIDVATAEKKTAPPAPFITSTLQQVASSKLKIKPKRTMALAQTLFSEGLITYHRTDSFSLSEDAIEAIRVFADANGYATPESPRSFKNKAGAQEGHEAIRPSNIDEAEPDVGNANSSDKADLLKLYKLIRNRAIASQLADYVEDVTKVTYRGVGTDGNDYQYHAKNGVMKKQGWKAFEPQASKNEALMPAQNVSDVISQVRGTVENKQTKIPSLFTEATLIKALEAKGIGRPSTYASIMERIDSHGYVSTVDKQYLDATERGVILFNILHDRFSFLKLSYTKEMEQQIDNVASGKTSYFDMVQSCYATLEKELGQLAGVERQSATYQCDKCSGEMRRIAKGKSGAFWGCGNFSQGCKNTWEDKGGKPVTPEHPDFGKKAKASDVRSSDKGEKCTKCGEGHMLLRSGPKSKFYGCSNYPNCRHTEPYKQSKKVA